MFRCPSCDAAPEPITGATMTIVRHAPGCPLLLAATRSRWPLVAAGLPDTPRPVVFPTRAGRVWPRRGILEERGIRAYSSPRSRRSKIANPRVDTGAPTGIVGGRVVRATGSGKSIPRLRRTFTFSRRSRLPVEAVECDAKSRHYESQTNYHLGGH